MSESVKFDLDVMIDLETFATCPEAAIVQIAAVPFHLDGRPVPGALFVNVSLDSNLSFERRINGHTVMWWLGQSEHARSSLINGPGFHMDLRAALSTFVHHLREWTSVRSSRDIPVRLWGHGAAFDIAILDSAYWQVFGQEPPWRYSAARDTRTLFHVADYPWDERFDELIGDQAHNALADAKAQAVMVQEAWAKLREVK